MKAQTISNDSIEFVLGKALLDEEFRNLLFANPDEALSGFNLTASEKKHILWMDSETLESLAQTLARCTPPVEHPIKGKSNPHSSPPDR